MNNKIKLIFLIRQFVSQLDLDGGCGFAEIKLKWKGNWTGN